MLNERKETRNGGVYFYNLMSRIVFFLILFQIALPLVISQLLLLYLVCLGLAVIIAQLFLPFPKRACLFKKKKKKNSRQLIAPSREPSMSVALTAKLC